RPAEVGGVLPPRALAEAVLEDRPEVDVDGHRVAGEREPLRLADDLAVLRDEPMAVPGEVRGRLPEARRAVELDGQVLGRGRAHEVLAVLPLADGHVGGGEIRQDRRTGESAD